MTEFQDVCRFCFNFESYCKCAYDGDSSEEETFEKKRAQSSDPKVLIYSAPTFRESVRKGVDVEEYCLKSRYRYKICPKESKAIMTNLVINRRSDEVPRKLEVKNRIRSEWLNETFASLFICKTGVVSPQFEGDLVIKIFNKTCDEIVIENGSPVAMLQSRPYEYE